MGPSLRWHFYSLRLFFAYTCFALQLLSKSHLASEGDNKFFIHLMSLTTSPLRKEKFYVKNIHTSEFADAGWLLHVLP